MGWFKKRGIRIGLFGIKDKLGYRVDEGDIVAMAEFFGTPDSQKEEIVKRFKKECNELIKLGEEEIKTEEDITNIDAYEQERKRISFELGLGKKGKYGKFSEEQMEDLRDTLVPTPENKKKKDELSKELKLIRIKIKIKCNNLLHLAEKILKVNPKSEFGTAIYSFIVDRWLGHDYMKNIPTLKNNQ